MAANLKRLFFQMSLIFASIICMDCTMGQYTIVWKTDSRCGEHSILRDLEISYKEF